MGFLKLNNGKVTIVHININLIGTKFEMLRN